MPASRTSVTLLLLRVLKDLKKPLGRMNLLESTVVVVRVLLLFFDIVRDRQYTQDVRAIVYCCRTVDLAAQEESHLPSALNKGAGLSVSGQCRHYVASLQSKWLTDV
jgi:hypothetical protein